MAQFILSMLFQNSPGRKSGKRLSVEMYLMYQARKITLIQLYSSNNRYEEQLERIWK